MSPTALLRFRQNRLLMAVIPMLSQAMAKEQENICADVYVSEKQLDFNVLALLYNVSGQISLAPL